MGTLSADEKKNKKQANKTPRRENGKTNFQFFMGIN